MTVNCDDLQRMARPHILHSMTMQKNEGRQVAFIGTGVMGAPMAGHLIEAGYSLRIHTRTKEKAKPLIERGAEWADTPIEAIPNADFVCTMVGMPSDLNSVYFDNGGIFAHVKKGAVLVDFTTSDPGLAQEIARQAESYGIASLDAPVTGGQRGALEARLSILVGGTPSVFDKAQGLLKHLGTPRLMGPSGSGQYAKLSNQVAIAGVMLGVCEALSFAIRSGLDPYKVLEGISGGAAASWTLQNLAPKMLAADFAPGFYVKHFIKDLKLAHTVATQLKLNFPCLSLALKSYEDLAAIGGSEFGTQALIKLYEPQS